MKKKLLLLSCIFAFSGFAVACNEEETTQEPAHEHSYAAAWTTSETEHWHAADCEHTTEVAGKAAHVDADKDGDCDVCAYEGLSVKAYVKAAVESAKTNANKVNGAKAVQYEDYWDSPIYLQATFGENCAQYISSESPFDEWENEGVYTGTVVSTALGEEGTFSVIENVDAETQEKSYPTRVDMGTGAHLGLVVEGSYLYMEESVIGAEAVVDTLWALAETDAYGTSTCSATDDLFAFTVDYMDVEEAYYITANVSFTLAEEGNLATASLKLEVYYIGGNSVIDVREEGAEEAVWQLNDFATADLTVFMEVEQTTGEKTYVAPDAAKAENILTDEIKLYSDETRETEVATALQGVAGEAVYVYLDESINWDNEEFVFTVADEKATVDYINEETAMWNDPESYPYIKIIPSVAGEIAITIDTDFATANVTVSAVLPPIENITPKIDGETVYGAIELFNNQEYTLSVAPYPTLADASYTANIVSSTAMLTNNEDGTYTFKALASGTHYISVISNTNNDVSTYFEITTVDKPLIEDILSGSYAADSWDEVSLVFAPTTEGATSGDLTLNISANWDNFIVSDLVYSYTYNETDGLVLTYKSGTEPDGGVTIEIRNYALVVAFYPYGTAMSNASEYDMIPVVVENNVEQVAFLTQNTFTMVDANDNLMYLVFDTTYGNVAYITDTGSNETASYIYQFDWSVDENGLITMENPYTSWGTLPTGFEVVSDVANLDMTSGMVVLTGPTSQQTNMPMMYMFIVA